MLSKLRSASRPLAALVGALAFCCASLAAAAAPHKDNPSWAQLSVQQQEILAPLAGEWDKLEPDRKQKWLGVAERYPKMTPTGQKRVQTRMRKWAGLTPEQREEARKKYLEMHKSSRKKKKDLSKEWSEYQSLPPQERQALVPEDEKSRARRLAKEPRKNSTPPAAGQQ